MLKLTALALAGLAAAGSVPANAAAITYTLSGSFALAGGPFQTGAIVGQGDTANAFNTTVDGQSATVIPLDAISLTIGGQTADLPFTSTFFTFPDIGGAGFEAAGVAGITFLSDALVGYNGLSAIGPVDVQLVLLTIGPDPVDVEGRGLTFTASLVSAVPEPATWTMMIAGFGLAGVAIRRSRRRTIPVRFA